MAKRGWDNPGCSAFGAGRADLRHPKMPGVFETGNPVISRPSYASFVRDSPWTRVMGRRGAAAGCQSAMPSSGSGELWGEARLCESVSPSAQTFLGAVRSLWHMARSIFAYASFVTVHPGGFCPRRSFQVALLKNPLTKLGMYVTVPCRLVLKQNHPDA